MGSIKLKALVHKENNRVLFAEADADFIDVLFSFLTMPMGTIVKLTRDKQPIKNIGCMNNLYASVENLDVNYFRTQECQRMLLHPRIGAATQYSDLKIQIASSSAYKYYYCGKSNCISSHKLVNHYREDCACGKNGYTFCWLDKYSDPRESGAFVKGQTRLLLSDKLQVIPPSTAASFALLSNFGVKDSSKVEDRTYDIGEYQLLNLLKSSMVSDAPLTETLLKKNETPELSRGNFHRWSSSFNHQLGEEKDRKISIKLLISKSKNILCYAEVGEDFVDLLFSFLTIPLGYIIKEMRGASSNGCLNHLYKSIEDLDVQKYFKSNFEKEILLSPKIAPKFGYNNQLIGVEEGNLHCCLAKDKTVLHFSTNPPCGSTAIALNVKDPKLPTYKEVTSNGGFMVGPAIFTVTDDLIVAIISPISAVSVLNKLNVPFSDIEERIVQVGTQEALCLLVASFTSESALTDTFIRKEQKEECF